MEELFSPNIYIHKTNTAGRGAPPPPPPPPGGLPAPTAGGGRGALLAAIQNKGGIQLKKVVTR